MAESNVIDDVRAAKLWVDQQSSTFAELGQRLHKVEQAYLERSGDFASVPREQPESVRQTIAQAQNEPGHALLNDVKARR